MTSTHVFVPLDIRVTLNFAHICEKAKFQAILLTDFSNFWNLGSKFLDFFSIFSNFLALPVSKFPAFFEYNGDRSTDPTPLPTQVIYNKRFFTGTHNHQNLYFIIFTEVETNNF